MLQKLRTKIALWLDGPRLAQIVRGYAEDLRADLDRHIQNVDHEMDAQAKAIQTKISDTNELVNTVCAEVNGIDKALAAVRVQVDNLDVPAIDYAKLADKIDYGTLNGLIDHSEVAAQIDVDYETMAAELDLDEIAQCLDTGCIEDGVIEAVIDRLRGALR